MLGQKFIRLSAIWIMKKNNPINTQFDGGSDMNVFENLGEEKAKEMIDELIAKGYSEDDAFTEVYSIECNMDEDDEE